MNVVWLWDPFTVASFLDAVDDLSDAHADDLPLLLVLEILDFDGLKKK